MFKFVTEIHFSHFLDAGNDQTHFNGRVVKELVASRRLYRSARGVLLFQPQPDRPGELVALTRVAELESVLRDGCVVKFVGETLSAEEMRLLCLAILDQRWKMPSASDRFAVGT
jgi:hypothetical protein